MPNFGTTPLSTTPLGVNQFPISAGFVPNTAGGNLTSIQLGPSSTDTGSYTSAPIATYTPDGNSLVEGSLNDASVTGDVSGTISAKLRGLSKIFAQLQFDGSNFLKVNVAAGTVAATQSGAWNITNVSGTVSLPTGAATSAKQPALGTAGTASMDVLTVQGITSMTALKVDGSGVTQPISGTVTANAGTGNFTVVQATASNFNAQVVGTVASGGSNAGNPVKVGGAFNSTQPTVTTGQAVDAQYTARGAAIVSTGVDAFAVNASQSGTWNITNVSGTVSLPTGAATSAKQPALGTAGSAASDVITVQGIASMTALKVDGSGVTQPVSGTVTANQGGSNWTTNVVQVGGTNVVTGGASGLLAVGGPVASGSSNADNPVKVGGVYNSTQPTVTNGQIVDAQMTARGARIVATGTDTFNVTVNAALPAGSAVIGSTTIQATSGTALVADQSNTELRISTYVKTTTAGDTALALGQATMANSLPVTMASNQGAVPVGPTAGTAFDTNEGTTGANTLRVVSAGAATGTKSNVASSASSVTILASNTARKGAIFYNDSTQILYLDLSGGTASSSSYSVQMPANSYFELPGPIIYNGAITGIWSSANGNMRITEFS